MRNSTTLRTTEEANFHRLVVELSWFGLGLAATTRFLSVYAIRLGASQDVLGWMVALPALLLIVSTGLGGWWLKRYSESTRAIYWPALLFRFVFFLPALAPLFPEQWRLGWIIVSAALPALAQGISSVVFMVMMREAVDQKQLTPLLSRRSLVLNITVAIGAVVFGGWLEVAPFPINYQIMFLAAFVFALASQWQLVGIKVKPIARVTAAVPACKIWRSHAFQGVALVAALTHTAFFVIAPVIPLHLVRGLGASEGFMAVFGLAELAAGATAAAFGSRIVKRIGSRNMIAIAMGGTALSAAVVAVAPNIYLTLLAAAISGASWTLAAMIGVFSFFVENISSEDMPPYTIAYQQILALGMFIGPLIGNGLSHMGINLVAILLVGAALRMLAGFVIWHNVTQPQAVRPAISAAVGD